MKRVVEVQLKDSDVLTVTYDRDALALAMAEGAPVVLLAEQQIGVTWGPTVDVLADVIVSWDLHDDEGRGYPSNRESLGHLPIVVLLKISQAISADAFEGEER